MPSITIRPAVVVAATLVLVACGDSAREEVDSERRAAALVVGSAAAEWGLLTIPRRGGTADLRPVTDPDSIVWNGTAELPVATGLWPVGAAAVVLRDEDDRLLRYDPVTDDVTELAELSADARPSGRTSAAIAFVDSAGRFVWEVGADYVHGHELSEPAAWAGPIDGGIAVLAAGDSGTLRLLHRADTAAAVEIAGAGRPPALVTAWGRRVVVTGPSGRSVRIYSVDGEPGLVGEAEVGGTIRTIEASPSSHEIYAALESPARIERISRFSLESEVVTELPAPAEAIRPGLFGGSLLVHTPRGPARIRTGANSVDLLAGSWRTDLPLGLPGDLSIVLVDDAARLVSVADSGGVLLAEGAPRWWVPLRFNPAADRDEVLREALDELGAEAGAPGGREEAVGEDTETARAEDLEMPEIERDAAAAQEGPPGYYAIVASTRQRAGVESLLGSLSEAGYPTRIQTYPDEAGEVWHRGLVGPFPSRARAQAAARQLLRERDLQAWVTEIGTTE